MLKAPSQHFGYYVKEKLKGEKKVVIDQIYPLFSAGQNNYRSTLAKLGKHLALTGRWIMQ